MWNVWVKVRGEWYIRSIETTEFAALLWADHIRQHGAGVEEVTVEEVVDTYSEAE